jgi:hypothetical protein
MTRIHRDHDETTLTVSNTDAILFRVGLRVAPIATLIIISILGWYMARQEKDHDTISDLKPRVHYIEQRLGITLIPSISKSYFDTNDVAANLGKSTETVRRYIKDGLLFPPPKIVKGQYIWEEPPTLLCIEPKTNQPTLAKDL